MCGIFAAFSLNSHRLDIDINATLKEASSLLNRRGPDNFGFYISPDNRSLLCHSRLSIQGADVESNQPYHCINGSIVVYNGEVYNSSSYNNIKTGYSGSSDTPLFAEVVSSDPSKLKSMEAMFSFLCYDPDQAILTYGRDIFGEKPLFSYKTSSTLFLFSDVFFLKLLRHWQLSSPELDQQVLTRFLVYGYRQAFSCTSGISFFKNVSAVTPGSLTTINIVTGETSTQQYYSLINSYKRGTDPGLDPRESLQDLIRERIGLRSVADVNTALSLSGGVDSSLLASILTHSSKSPTLAFTIDSNDARYSEAVSASNTSAHLGIQHQAISISADETNPVRRLQELTEYRASPVLTITSLVSSYIYASSSKLGCSVVFSGAGADELFTGYYDYFFYRMFASDYTEREYVCFLKYILPNIRNSVMSRGRKAATEIINQSHHYVDTRSSLPLLNISSEEADHLLQRRAYCYLTQSSDHSSILRQSMLYDLTRDVIPVILHEDDLNSMHYSVENRSPFLSPAIFEASCLVPDNLFMQDGYQKYPLRLILASYEQCTDIAFNRHKIGFNFSFTEFSQSDPLLIQETMQQDTPLWNIYNKDLTLSLFFSSQLPEALLFRLFSVQTFLIYSRMFN